MRVPEKAATKVPGLAKFTFQKYVMMRYNGIYNCNNNNIMHDCSLP